jgi:hypothetical protein
MHIEDKRLHQFASDEMLDLTQAENAHLDDCATCWGRLVTAVQLVFLMRVEPKTHLIM